MPSVVPILLWVCKHGYTALMLAVRDGGGDLVQILLTMGSRIRVQNKIGNTAASLAAAQQHDGVARMIRHALYERYRMTLLCLVRMGLPEEIADIVWAFV
eukprot:m.180283 g.180283  ORF g.180283 m.180283 type:complete len:100 (+) comp18411_c0_seq4:967-1266(+)